MIEHTYYICKSSWWIHIKVLAEIVSLDNTDLDIQANEVTEGIWLKFSEEPINKNEKFCDDDLPYLIKGLSIVQKQIIKNSKYKNTLIIIESLQFSPCDFQEEGLTALMIEWASKAFEFETPSINVTFQRENNRYVFDFGDVLL